MTTEQQTEQTVQPTEQDVSLTPEQARDAAMQVADVKSNPELEPTPEPTAEPAANFEAKYDEAMVRVAKKDRENRELMVRIEQLEKHSEELQNWQSTLKDPMQTLKALESQGMDYRKLTNAYVSADEEPKTPEQQKIEQLEAQLEQITNTLQAEQEEKQLTKQQQEQMSAYQYCQNFIDEHADKYPYIKALERSGAIAVDYQKAISKLAELGYDDIKKIPENLLPKEHDIAAAVEQRLKAGVEKTFGKLSSGGVVNETLSSLGYIKQKTEQQTEQKPAQQAHTGQKPQTVPDTPTLTNDMGATPDEGFDYAKVLREEGPNSPTLRQRAMSKAGQGGEPPYSG